MADAESIAPAGIEASLRWNAVATVSVRVLSAVRGLVVARIVGPRDLGVFAAVVAFSGVANLLAELGLQSYLIHRGPESRSDARAVFEVALGTAAIGALALFVGAGAIANLYDEPDARAVAMALALSVLMTGLAVVPGALLRASLDFGSVARSQVAGEVVGLAVGIGLAIAGAGVWSLVGGALANQGCAVSLLWLASPRVPADVSEERAATRKRALRFGFTVALGGATWAIALQGDNIAVGNILDPRQLGFYAFAYNYGVLPGVMIGGIVSDVALASFSTVQSLAERRELFLRFSRLTAALGAPLIAVAVALAPRAVELLLGPTWLPSVGPLRVILVVGWLRGLFPAEMLLRATGRVGVEVWIGAIAAPVVIAAAVVGAHDSILAVAVFVGVVLSVAAVVSTGIGARVAELSLTTLSRAVALPVALGACAGLVSWGISAVLDNNAAACVVAGLTALGGYALVLRSVSPRLWDEVVAVARGGAAQAL